MRVIALEEHFTAPHLVGRIDAEVVRRRGFRPRRVAPGAVNLMELAAEVGERRVRLMDESGITMQVLSNTGPGPELVPGPEGVAMAAAMNDYLAEAVARAGPLRRLRGAADARRCVGSCSRKAAAGGRRRGSSD